MTDRATTLETPRLLLRRARPDDLNAIHRIMSDDETMRFWSTPPHDNLDQTRSWLDKMIAADPAESDEFVIEKGDELIGKLGAWRIPEIGFFLARDHWGRGYAAEALDAFIVYAADRLFPDLTADVDPLNSASLALLIRAGFRETGREAATYMVGDRVCDSVYLRLDLQRALFTTRS